MLPKTLAAAAGAAAMFVALPAAAEPWLNFSSDGDWMIRVRALGAIPMESLKVNGMPGADASISTSVVPEVDFTYFFTPNFAAELILGTTHHDVQGRGTLSGTDLGSVWLLPPTLTAQYHVTQLGEWTGEPAWSKFQPYVGAGVNYTFFYDARAGDFNKISYDDSFGWALQVGFDYEISEGFYFNADVKYIFLDTDYKINNGAVRGSVDVNPLLIGVGLGVRF